MNLRGGTRLVGLGKSHGWSPADKSSLQLGLMPVQVTPQVATPVGLAGRMFTMSKPLKSSNYNSRMGPLA